ncbi:hypothetical protein V1478_015986, partial [Vespula squamosa]
MRFSLANEEQTMYYPLDRLNVGGYAEFDGKSEKTGVSWKGCLCGWCSLGHFTQIAWILQIAHTSRPLPLLTFPTVSAHESRVKRLTHEHLFCLYHSCLHPTHSPRRRRSSGVWRCRDNARPTPMPHLHKHNAKIIRVWSTGHKYETKKEKKEEEEEEEDEEDEKKEKRKKSFVPASYERNHGTVPRVVTPLNISKEYRVFMAPSTPFHDHRSAGSGSPAKWEIAGELQRQAIADAMDPRTLCVDSTKTVAPLWTRQSIEATET